MAVMTKNLSMDFAGFVDGFQARNLASINRNVSLQLSEMQTRLKVIRGNASSSHADFIADVDAIQKVFQKPDDTIVNRLATVGSNFTDLLLKNNGLIASDTQLQTQIKGFLQAYADAAEISSSETLRDAAIRAISAFQEISV